MHANKTDLYIVNTHAIPQEMGFGKSIWDFN